MNRIRDVNTLASLPNLTYLNLGENQIIDISHLSIQRGLAVLDLHGNQVSGIVPLASLTNLTNLNIGENQIIDVSPLTNQVRLTYLDLHENQTYAHPDLIEQSRRNHEQKRQEHCSDLVPSEH